MNMPKLFSRRRSSLWWTRLIIFLSVIGPGIITGTADNDAGGITTYSVAGAHFGYKMLWILIVITFMLYVTQEMGARLGVVTGKGLGDLIRERLGARTAVILISLVLLVNFTNVLADVSGIAAVADIYHIPRILFVPLFSFTIWYIILKGSFNFVQNIFLTSSILFFCYIINGFIAKPDMGQMIQGSLVPALPLNREYIFTATALIGTTLTVWGQFFIQSYFVDKGITKKNLRTVKLDILFGAFWTDVVAYFIIISTAATLFVYNIRINTATDAAIALEPLLGSFSKHLFAWGLLNASLLGTGVIAMGTAYAVTEVLGTERKMDSSFAEASIFYYVIGALIFISTIAVLVPQLPLVPIMMASQALNTVLLPIIFYVILLMINDKSIMGKYANNRIQNIVSWITIVSFTIISAIMVYLVFF